MIRPALTERATAARTSGLVARLLIGLGLALTLLVGSWVATHAGTEDLQVAPIAELIATNDLGVVPGVMADGHAGEAEDLGAALCLLGVACVLALVIFAWRAPSRTCSTGRVTRRMRETVARQPSQSPILTLTQLRVSRT